MQTKQIQNNLKAVSYTDKELRVANYIVLFGGKDLQGEHFTKNTDFESAYTESGLLHIDFEHGLDPDKLGMKADDVLGVVDWKTAKADDNGIFVERVLNRQARYMDSLEVLIAAGVVGTSSQAVTGKAQKVGGEIVKWPLMRDSLTFTPAEPRMLSGNALFAAKSLLDDFPEIESLKKAVTESDIKSILTKAESLKEIEAVLRDVGQFSRADSTLLVSRVKAIAHGERDVIDNTNELIAAIKAATNHITQKVN